MPTTMTPQDRLNQIRERVENAEESSSACGFETWYEGAYQSGHLADDFKFLLTRDAEASEIIAELVGELEQLKIYLENGSDIACAAVVANQRNNTSVYAIAVFRAQHAIEKALNRAAGRISK